MSFTLTRQQLYDLVWSQAMQKIARQVGISDVAIVKRCKIVDVPVPPRGYWNKKQAGRHASQLPLPPRDPSTAPTVAIFGTLTDELRSLITGEPGIELADESIDVLLERFKKRLGTIKVPLPARIYTAHPVIASLLATDDEIRAERKAGKFPRGETQFDAPFERRRIILLNALFLGLKRVGCGASARGAGARELCAHFGDSYIKFSLDALDARSDEFSQNRLRSSLGTAPMGLKISADHSYKGKTYWSEDEDTRLDDHLTDIVISMATAAEEASRRWRQQQITEEAERRRRLEEETQRRVLEAERLELERIEAAERDRVAALRTYAEQWKAASVIREFVRAVNSYQFVHQSPEALAAWTFWAEKVTAGIDPFSSGMIDRSIVEIFALTLGASSAFKEP